jgi:hypothetical protein
MAVTAFINGYVSINGTDLSSYCKKLELSVDVADLDTTTMSSGGYHARIGGLKDATLSLTFNQDVAAAALDSILWPLNGTVVTFEVRATQAVAGTSNPKFTGSVLVKGLTPLSGSVGDLLEQSVTWPVSGPVTRATS